MEVTKNGDVYTITNDENQAVTAIETQSEGFIFMYQGEQVQPLRVFRDPIAGLILAAARALKNALTTNNW